MPDEFRYDVFLSHNHADKPRIRRLAERLKAAGVRVWLDEWDIKAGDIIALKVDGGLEQSRVLLLCISPEALASGWVALERYTAVHRDPANAGRRFIPLLLGNCALPDSLRRYKYVDFREESEAAFMEVLAACRTEAESSLSPTQTTDACLQSPIVIEATDPRLKLMVSSTIIWLPKHREQMIGAINRMGHMALIQDCEKAQRQPNVIEASLDKVADSQVYIGVFGQCYGEISDDLTINPERLSVAEMEYRHAVKLGRPALLFIAKQTHPFSIEQVDLDTEKRAKLERLKSEILASNICGFFDSPEELRELVFVALQRIQVRSAKPGAVIVQGDFGMPSPPEFLAVPQYTLTGKFVGRSSELSRLDEWAKSKDNIMVVEGIGGLGKSAVTWEWMMTRAKAAMPKLAGCIWWSFYEHGTSLVTFVRFALAYVTGQNPQTLLEGWSHYQRGEQLLRELNRRPYLLVLDGFERVLTAYHQIDKALIPDHQVEEHRCECINPPDGELLIQLLRCKPSKVLISTRLFPNDLLDRGSHRPATGVARHILDGLSPTDALALVKQAGITGSEAAILAFAEQFARHSLLLKVVCGLIADYRRRPLDFDAWHADPTAGGGLKLAELELKQRRTHILHYALSGLISPIRTLLCRIAIVTESVSYDMIEILNPFQPPRPPERENCEAHHQSQEYLEGLKKLDAGLQELEDRGLLQWDRDSNRYDMHPIVRAHASEMLDSADRTATFQTVHDHFASLPPDNLAEATELTHVARSLEIYRCLIGAGRNDEAARFINGDLSNSLLFYIGAFGTIVELLTPLFPKGFQEPPIIRGRLMTTRLLNTLAISVSYAGQDEEALNLTTTALRTALNLKDWTCVSNYLDNIGGYLDALARRAEAAEACELARLIGEAIKDQDRMTMYLLHKAVSFFRQGRYAEGEASLVRFHKEPLPHVGQYRLGYAEHLMCHAKFEQGILTPAEWQDGFNLAVKQRSLQQQYQFKSLWAEAELAAGRPTTALEAIDEALQIVNRIGIRAPHYHDLRAWALACLGRGAEAKTELEKGKRGIFAAEAWLALGERDSARVPALNGYRWAWGEGPPHVESYYLRRCREVLGRLNEPVPTLPTFDAATRQQIPFEQEIRAELPSLKPIPCLYLITGKHKGEPAWYYVAVDQERLSDFEAASATGSFDIADYGRVVESGYGMRPPDSVMLRFDNESASTFL